MNDVKVVLEQTKVITKDDLSEEQLREMALSLTYTQQQISAAVSEVVIMSMVNGEEEMSEGKVIRSVARVIRALAKRDGLYDEYDELVKKAKSQAKSVYVYAYVSSILVGTAALISLIISSL